MWNLTVMKNRVIIIAPHPDDEILGCGGAILKHKQNGDIVAILYITNCLPEFGFSEERCQSRQSEIDSVKNKCNINFIYKLDLAPSKLEKFGLSDLIKKISNVFHEFKPNIVYINNYGDAHSDHEIAFKATYSCTKSFRYPFIEKIYIYEVPSETEFGYKQNFKPNSYVDITTFIDNKLELMSIYASEVMRSPYPRSLDSIRALARWRGSRIGVEYAEAFMLLYERR